MTDEPRRTQEGVMSDSDIEWASGMIERTPIARELLKTLRHHQERALSAERVLDCGHPAACLLEGALCGWCSAEEKLARIQQCVDAHNSALMLENLEKRVQIVRAEERARIAEGQLDAARRTLVAIATMPQWGAGDAFDARVTAQAELAALTRDATAGQPVEGEGVQGE